MGVFNELHQTPPKILGKCGKFPFTCLPREEIYLLNNYIFEEGIFKTRSLVCKLLYDGYHADERALHKSWRQILECGERIRLLTPYNVGGFATI